MGYSAQSFVWVDYVPVFTGWASNTITYAKYMVIGNLCHVQVRVAATTSNATTKTATLPFPGTQSQQLLSMWHTNNGAADAACGRMDIANGSSVLTLYRDGAALAWTGSGTCQVLINLTYQI